MRRLAFAIMLLASSPAFALTGAELKQTSENFGRGYVWGVLETYLSLSETDPVIAKIIDQRGTCVSAAKINSTTAYKAVIAYIDRHPEKLPDMAIGAVIGFIAEMCP